MTSVTGSLQGNISRYRNAHYRVGMEPRTRLKPLFKRSIVPVPYKRVPPRVMRNLDIGDATAKTIRAMLPFSGNQKHHVYQTAGLAWERMESYSQVSGSGRSRDIASPLTSGLGVGNCIHLAGVAAGVFKAMPESERPTEVTLVASVPSDRDRDCHMIVTLGDPRQRRPKDVVVVDPWPLRVSAHTLDECSLPIETLQVSSFTGRYDAFLAPDFWARTFEVLTDDEYCGTTRENPNETRIMRQQSFVAKTGMGSNAALRNNQTSLHEMANWNTDAVRVKHHLQYYQDDSQPSVVKSYDYNFEAIVDGINDVKACYESSYFPSRRG